MNHREHRRLMLRMALEYIWEHPWCPTEEVRAHVKLFDHEARSMLRWARQKRLLRSRMDRLELKIPGGKRIIITNRWNINER